MASTTSPDAICARIAKRLEQAVGPHRFSMWFDRSARMNYQDSPRRLDVAVPNAFVADWIGRHFTQELRTAAHHELGQDVDLNLHVDPRCFGSDTAVSDRFERSSAARPGDGTRRDTDTTAPAHAATHAASPQRHGNGEATLTPIALASQRSHLRYRLEDFIVGPSNELAFAAAQQLVSDTAHVNPLFMHGGCGLGKTHLLQGICRRMLHEHPNAKVHYTTGEQFTNDYIQAVRANKLEAFRQRIRRLDLLAVDDIHFIAGREKTQQEFLHSFDAIELSGARVVMASDCHPKLIAQFTDALTSRCMRGMVVEIKTPDTETRLRIVRALAQRRGINMLETVVAVLASRCRGSVREIEGTLTKLHALANLTRHNGRANGEATELSGGPIGHALVERLFESDQQGRTRKPVRFETIVDVVCEHLQVARAKIMGNSRHKMVVLARSLVIYLGRQLTTHSYPEIAAAMGRTSHSTIVTACRRVENMVREEGDTMLDLPPTLTPSTLNGLIDQLRQAISTA